MIRPEYTKRGPNITISKESYILTQLNKVTVDERLEINFTSDYSLSLTMATVITLIRLGEIKSSFLTEP